MLALGRNSEAVDQFRMALKLRPEYPTARYNLARALIKSGRLVEATDLYRQVVRRSPTMRRRTMDWANCCCGNASMKKR